MFDYIPSIDKSKYIHIFNARAQTVCFKVETAEDRDMGTVTQSRALTHVADPEN